MPGAFKDHFSDAPNDYRAYRPHYPSELFSYLASISPGKQTAWDCATGSGQSALAMSAYFSAVIATDASAEQIQNAQPGAGISYRVAAAERSGIDADSVDLITVAQALHWFDIPAFFEEVHRVLKIGGVLAIWTYNLLEIQAQIDRLLNHLYGSILGDYWPPERTMVENGYAKISFPFEELNHPEFKMTAQWNLSQLLGYLRTWSALKQYKKQHGVDPIETMLPAFTNAWGEAESMRPVHWPLSLRLCKKR